MRAIYFDCTNGVSGDMVSAALKELCGFETGAAISEESCGHGHTHRCFADIREIINKCDISGAAKEKALSIYKVIAEAEAAVHETNIKNVHFHEVGRNKAIENIIGAAVCADALLADRIFVSEICDGKGSIECSHGVIPVPVPAVMAMRGKSSLIFKTDESVRTEMVTPSGLAILIGLGASYRKEIPEGGIIKKTVAYGARETGRKGGLTAYLTEI